VKYRKRPVVVDAFQWTGDIDQIEDPEWIVNLLRSGQAGFIESGEYPLASEVRLYIDTLEGRMVANRGDWIIRGIKGEVYLCKPDIFAATYEPVDL
jgi:hypothetical protein